MFASLSQKWYASNPLEMPKTAGPTAAPAQQPNSSEPNAFGSKPVLTTSSAPAPSPFNTTTPAPAKTTDSAPAPSPFGVAAPAASPFGTTAPAPANSPFGTAASAPAPAAKSSEPDYHKILTEFYQKHNAEKVGEVAKTLEKYKVRATAQIQYSTQYTEFLVCLLTKVFFTIINLLNREGSRQCLPSCHRNIKLLTH